MKPRIILIGVAALLTLLNLTGCVLVPYDDGYSRGYGDGNGHRYDYDHDYGHGYRHHHDWRRDERW